jgi:hypothetical protein
MPDSDDVLDYDDAAKLRAMIETYEACGRGSYSRHVADWYAYRVQRKHPLVHKSDRTFLFDACTT